jgi:dihydroflavonol-4-reductase
MAPILVIGGTGFIGSRVVQQLLAAGHSVRCLIRASSRIDRLEGLSLNQVVGDLRDSESLVRAAEGCGSIIHLGGISAWADIDSPEMFPVVVEGTRNVLQAAEKCQIKRVVYVSSAAAMGPCDASLPRDEKAPFDGRRTAGMIFLVAKREAARLCLVAASRGIATVIVRPVEVYGPGDRDLITASNLIGMLKSSPVLVCTGGTSIVHVDDAASGIVRAWEQGRSGEVYLLGGDNLNHSDLARLLLELANRRATILRIPNLLLRIGAATAKRYRLPFPVPVGVVPYATRYWFVDSRKARTELGLTFRSARETIADTLQWIRTAGKC